MQYCEFSIMADISGKENSEFCNSILVNVSVPSIGKKHSTNQNKIAFKK